MAEPAVVDTVVLRYFLFVDRFDLLVALLGTPLRVPRIVYDPHEGEPPEIAMSEVTRSIFVQRRTADDSGRPRGRREIAERNANRLGRIHGLEASGDIEVVDLTIEEGELFARLSSAASIAEFGLKLPIGPGEAACVAIAVKRGWVCVSDDTDGLNALDKLDKGHPYERIRRLLQRAATERLIRKDEANSIHAEMRMLGFWDIRPPFPEPRPKGKPRR
jgi:hypothetical protein